jgi:hypothetical protein
MYDLVDVSTCKYLVGTNITALYTVIVEPKGFFANRDSVFVFNFKLGFLSVSVPASFHKASNPKD